jgi:hypothetical protein
MKKTICIMIVVLTSSISLGQSKKNNLKGITFKESDVVFKCDSLSKVYNLDVVSYKTVNRNGVMKHFICYYGKNELLDKEIPKPVR